MYLSKMISLSFPCISNLYKDKPTIPEGICGGEQSKGYTKLVESSDEWLKQLYLDEKNENKFKDSEFVYLADQAYYSLTNDEDRFLAFQWVGILYEIDNQMDLKNVPKGDIEFQNRIIKETEELNGIYADIFENKLELEGEDISPLHKAMSCFINTLYSRAKTLHTESVYEQFVVAACEKFKSNVDEVKSRIDQLNKSSEIDTGSRDKGTAKSAKINDLDSPGKRTAEAEAIINRYKEAREVEGAFYPCLLLSFILNGIQSIPSEDRPFIKHANQIICFTNDLFSWFSERKHKVFSNLVIQYQLLYNEPMTDDKKLVHNKAIKDAFLKVFEDLECDFDQMTEDLNELIKEKSNEQVIRCVFDWIYGNYYWSKKTPRFEFELSPEWLNKEIHRLLRD